MQTTLIEFGDVPSLANLHKAGVLAARRAIVQEYGDELPGAISIEKGAGGKPYAMLAGEQIAISISHAAPYAYAAASLQKNVLLGVDIEKVRRFKSSLYRAFCNASEMCLIEACKPEERPIRTTLAWSLKESALKALGMGLRVHPQLVDVSDAFFDQGERTISIAGIDYRADVSHSGLRRNTYVMTTVVLLCVPIGTPTR